jgi:hypothetical protein
LQRLNPGINRVNGFTAWQSLSRIFDATKSRESTRRGVEQSWVMAFKVDRSRTIITAMIHGRRITAMDVAWLRREVFATGEVSREAADELFAVERAGLANAPEWTEFFVEMIVDHVVWQSGEPGVLGDAEAKWLSERVSECESANALAALAAVLGEARRAPASLVAAAHARAWPAAAAPTRTAQAV